MNPHKKIFYVRHWVKHPCRHRIPTANCFDFATDSSTNVLGIQWLEGRSSQLKFSCGELCVGQTQRKFYELTPKTHKLREHINCKKHPEQVVVFDKLEILSSVCDHLARLDSLRAYVK